MKGPSQKEIDKEEAYADCIKYRPPTPGVDHSNHYRPIEELMYLETYPKKNGERND